MTHYTWEDAQARSEGRSDKDEVADLARIAEDIERRTSLARMAKHAPTAAPTVDFTREGIEQLQHDVITFLDQFDEMPQGLVDEICQTIINYYIKHKPNPVDLLNPSGDHKTI